MTITSSSSLLQGWIKKNTLGWQKVFQFYRADQFVKLVDSLLIHVFFFLQCVRQHSLYLHDAFVAGVCIGSLRGYEGMKRSNFGT